MLPAGKQIGATRGPNQGDGQAPGLDMATAVRLENAGRRGEAEQVCRQILENAPEDAAAWHLLGVICHHDRRATEAFRFISHAVALAPNVADYHNSLGILHAHSRYNGKATSCFRKALELRPRYPEALNNLGAAMEASGLLTEAAGCYRSAIDARPTYAEPYNNWGNVLRKQGRFTHAIARHLQALRLKPTFSAAYNNLAAAYQEQGRLEDAIACHRRLVVLQPDSASVHGDLLSTLLHSEALTPQQLVGEHRLWNFRHAARFDAEGVYPNDRSPQRKLRIGYLSPDFREHPVTHFIGPLLANHDRQHFEVFCYAQLPKPDKITERVRTLADAWRDVTDLSDDGATELIRRDRIDLLVDLAGHMGNLRSLVLARKPAPIQVSYCGYPATTGISATDFRVTDAHLDPVGLTDGYYTEKLIRLEGCCYCFDPGGADPVVSPLPALQSGVITFGVLNRLVKVRPPMVRLWAQILEGTPDSRLLMRGEGPETADSALARMLRDNGVPLDRVTFVGAAPDRRHYLERYRRIDVALDTFPYGGTTTTCDALWMGVPTITLAGDLGISRSGVTLLSSVGLEECIATTPRQYVSAAVDLAKVRSRLSALRAGLRQRMARSQLMDYPGHARRIESAYRTMWMNWCRK